MTGTKKKKTISEDWDRPPLLSVATLCVTVCHRSFRIQDA